MCAWFGIGNGIWNLISALREQFSIHITILWVSFCVTLRWVWVILSHGDESLVGFCGSSFADQKAITDRAVSQCHHSLIKRRSAHPCPAGFCLVLLILISNQGRQMKGAEAHRCAARDLSTVKMANICFLVTFGKPGCFAAFSESVHCGRLGGIRLVGNNWRGIQD